MDGQVIFSWIEKYDIERTEIVTGTVESNHHMALSDFADKILLPQPTEMSEKVQKMMNQMINFFGKKAELPDDFGKRNVVATPEQQQEKLNELSNKNRPNENM